MADETIKPCAGCGRPTRPLFVSAEDAPGTVVRQGSWCTTCRHAKTLGTTRETRLSTEPLTADEQLVLRAVARRCEDDAAEVAAMLGLTREEVPA